jgi:predicted DNA-binding transcriptional regulator AlpA
MNKHQCNKEFDSRQLFTLQVGELEVIVSKLVDDGLSRLTTSQTSIKGKEDDLVPRIEIAREFKISLVTLDKWIKLKLLPKPIKQGGRIYFLRSDISEHINKRRES